MSTKNTAIQIRVDEKTKREAQKTLEALGLDMSSAVNMFLRNVVNSQSIPLDLRTENGFTLAQEQALIAETKKAKKGEGYDTLDDLFSDLEL